MNQPSAPATPYAGLLYSGLVLMLACALGLFLWARHAETEEIRAGLQEQVNAAAMRLEAGLSRYLMALTAVEGLFAASESVELPEFQRLADALQRDLPEMYGLGWYQAVNQADRTVFEARMAALGQPGYRISDRGAEGLVPASDRERYVVVAMARFVGQPLSVQGFDIFSNAVRRDMVLKAEASGLETLSGRILLVSDKDPGYDLLAVRQVRGAGFVPGGHGFAGMALHVSTLMKNALQGTGNLARARLYDRSATVQEALLYGDVAATPALAVTRPLKMGGRDWELEWGLDEAALAAQRGWEPWVLLAFALTTVLLLDLLLRLLLGRAARVQTLVERRTAELAARETELRQTLTRLTESETRLRKTAHSLEISNRELEQFAYVASHDLQSPLRGIVSFSQLLRRRHGERLDADGLEHLAFIENGCKRMSQLVRDLLEFSRVGRTQEAFTRQPLDYSLSAARLALADAMAASHAEVIAEGLPLVYAEHGQLARLFQNLLGNALKYQPLGQRPRIEITARETGTHWIVRVQDNGIGIPDNQLENIFTVFRRLHTEDQYEGTGIGLAICRKIMAHHGGRIQALAVEQGACFEFELPKAD